jgi:hypothetical protein
MDQSGQWQSSSPVNSRTDGRPSKVLPKLISPFFSD